VTAQSAVQIAGVNRSSAILFYHKLREVVFAEVEAEAPELLRDEIEVDDRYFGGQQKGKRRCGAGKVNVCGLLKRQGKVQVVIIPDSRSDTLIPIIPEKLSPTASSSPMLSAATTCSTSLSLGI
jgi:transposase